MKIHSTSINDLNFSEVEPFEFILLRYKVIAVTVVLVIKLSYFYFLEQNLSSALVVLSMPYHNQCKIMHSIQNQFKVSTIRIWKAFVHNADKITSEKFEGNLCL